MSRPCSRDTALARRLAGPLGVVPGAQPGVQRIDVISLAGGKSAFMGQQGGKGCLEISVTSIRRSEAGGYEVQLHGIDPNKVFTFVSHDGKWSLKGAATTQPAAR